MKQLAEAIEKLGKSRYQISKETGIDQAILCRIATGSGTGSCSLKTLDLLCEYLGLSIYRDSRGDYIMGGRKKPEAEKIQLRISQRLNKMKATGMKASDYEFLWKWTHKLFDDALEAEKLKEIKKIIEK